MVRSPALRQSKSLWSYNPIPTGCVLYLPFWHPDLRGDAFKSADPFGHECTNTGTVQQFDGRLYDSDDKIVVPNHASLSMNGDWYIAIWYKTSDLTTGQRLIDKSTGTRTNYDIEFDSANNRIRVQIDNSTNPIAVTGNNTISANTSHFVEMMIDKGSTLTTAVDLVDGSGVTEDSGESTVANDVWIGRRQRVDSQSVVGVISELWMYSRLLTTEQRTDLRNQSRRPWQ